MPIFPDRTELADTYPNPSVAVFKTGIGKLWDALTGLLGSDGKAATARAALGLARSDYFRVAAQTAPDMTVTIGAGKLQNGITLVSQNAQTTPAIAAPAANPRNDLIVIDMTSGAYTRVAGAEAASPADPAVPAGKIAVARLRLTVAVGSITDAMIDDLRPSQHLGAQTDLPQTFSAPQRTSDVTDNDGSFDLNAGLDFKCTPTAGITLTFTNIPAAPVCQKGEVLLVNGSNYAVTAHANTKVDSSFLGTVSATGTYRISYRSDGTNVYCVASKALS